MSLFIAVYADWEGLAAPLRLGLLHAQENGKEQRFEFERDALASDYPVLANLNHLDLETQALACFADAGPGAWGRSLMCRWLEREQRAGQSDPSVQLQASDYLLGVHDIFRSGALRFRLNDTGNFLENRDSAGAPPFVHLRELEAASLAQEQDRNNTDDACEEGLRMLMAPGASLGGARPKASVVDPGGHLWIAKFPGVDDDHDVGAWEMVVHTLARACGLQVTDSLAKRFSGEYHSFLARRFDRSETRQRLHFASAMTMTGNQLGDGAANGVGYLDLARVLIDQGTQTAADLRELWSRIVFNTLISNADDHLRNHGFILVPGKGWRLAEAYGMNPVPQTQGLKSGFKLNISASENEMSLELVRSVAHYFRIDAKTADDIIDRSRAVVRQWPKIATRLGISLREREWMRPAFRLAN